MDPCGQLGPVPTLTISPRSQGVEASPDRSGHGSPWGTVSTARDMNKHKCFRNSFINKSCKTITTAELETVQSKFFESC